MANTLTVPNPTKEPGQRSINVADMFLAGFSAPWGRPSAISPDLLRRWVLQQPVAVACRETLIASLIALDWKITPRDPKYKDELAPVIRHYTRLLEKGGNYPELSLDFSGLIEWVMGDYLDLSFGGAAELGRKGNSRDGRVMWIRPLDGATLYPTLNADVPVMQMVGLEQVGFPEGFISRVYMSPIQSIYREGWGMSPIEKIYFAFDMITKGDKYYANLLLDVPPVGVFDLKDVKKEDAELWVQSFKADIANRDLAWKIPVLYEHNEDVKFIPFGKVPNDIMYDKITTKYSALICAGYGLTLSDIGLSSSASGDTLSGAIRQERSSKRNGKSRAKKAFEAFINSFLPETLQFNWIDLDDELNVALGRARLATATAFRQMNELKAFGKTELRSQFIQDGLMSLSFDENPPDDDDEFPVASPTAKRGEMLGNPVPPSAGGVGEVKVKSNFKPNKKFDKFVGNLIELVTPQILRSIDGINEDELFLVRSTISDSLVDETDVLQIGQIVDTLSQGKLGTLKIELPDGLDVDQKRFEELLNREISRFIGRSVAIVLNDYVFDNVDNLTDNYSVDTVKDGIQAMLEKSIPEFVQIFVSEKVNKLKNGDTND